MLNVIVRKAHFRRKNMFAEKLKTLRGKKSLTQEEFAREINVTKGAVAMWETGKRTPDLTMIKKIAEYFDITVDELIGGSVDRRGLDEAYFSFAKSAQDEGIDPDDIKLALETIRELKYRNKREG